MRYIFILIIVFLLFPKSSFAFLDQKSIYDQAIRNAKNKCSYLKSYYTKEVVNELDKANYTRKKYSTRLKLLYNALAETEKILTNKLANIEPALDINEQYKAVVFLDPGHGGKDTGATVPPCLWDRNQIALAESDITFAIAKIIQFNLAKKGYAVILSRDSITDGPSLFTRSALCRAINPDLSISIHLNSTQYAYPVYDVPETAMPEINYSRVFVWSPGSNDLLLPFYLDIHNEIVSSYSRERSLDLAQITALSLKKYLGVDFYLPEDKLMALANLKKLRSELQYKNTVASSKTQYAKVSENIVPAEVSELNKKISKKYNNQVKNLSGIDGKDLHMVREMPSVPSILVEPIFISNPAEQRLLKDSDRINQIAKAIEQAIIEYLEKYKE